MLIIAALIIGGYTNHAGNVVAGWPVKLTSTQVALAERAPDTQLPTPNSQHPTPNHSTIPLLHHSTTNHYALTTNDYALSIFPESEQRRIAADFVRLHGGGQVGLLRIPVAVKRAIAGAEKAMARSRRRAEKGLCTKEESEAFCAKSEAALRNYLDKQVESGAITPAERNVLRR